MQRPVTVLFALLLLALPAAPQTSASQFFYSHLTQAIANNLISSRPTELHTITVNSSTSGTIAIQDTAAANCSGGVAISGTSGPLTAGSSLKVDVLTTNGLCITTGGTIDITVSWR
jgi:hypothetical protein